MRIVVLADTHLRAGIDQLPDSVLDAVASADTVLHAGDVLSRSAFDELSALAPIYAVLGNNDHELRGTLPETVLVDLGGVQVAMVHDSGARTGRPGRLRRRFPTADLVVFGHSHVPCDEVGVGGQLLFNPGSATQRRGQPACTFGILDLTSSVVTHREIRTV